MRRELKILMLEDIAMDAELETRALQSAGIACITKRVENEADFRQQLDEFSPDLIISDFSLPSFDGPTALRIAQSQQPNTPFIFVSGTMGEERAIESLKGGASDYVLKTNPARLPPAVLRAIREAEDRRQREKQEQKITRLSRIHAVLSAINSALVRIRDRQELYREACRIAIQHGHFKMAWIGIRESGAAKLKLMAWNGDTTSHLDKKDVALAKVLEDDDIGGLALSQKRTTVANDLETDDRVVSKQDALKCGLRSLIALPLVVNDNAIAVFLIYAGDSQVFDQEQIGVLSEMAGNISFALEYMEKEERLNYMAYHDVLTGLPNRDLLSDRLTQTISHNKRLDLMVAVAFIDLDHFKSINDSLGHMAGDHLLKVVSNRLTACLRDGDTIARLGSDEFVMLLSGQSDVETTTRVVQRVLATVREPVESGENEINSACSIGIALYPQDGDDAETLLKHADVAMYRAKESGRNTFKFYADEMNQKINERLLIESKLRRAIERDELFLNYQPQIDLSTGAVIGVEALARWQNVDLGLVSPARFIPLAEETDLILVIGEWVLRQACKQNKAWQEMGLPRIKISVNVSAKQFKQLDLPAMTGRVLRDTGLDPRYLDLELTESIVMHDVVKAIATMRALQAIGMELSIDDFGTGYSRLSYLKRFPVNRLKIDQSFVGDLATDPDDAAIAQSIISLGHGLGLKVIAEGVETKEQAASCAIASATMFRGSSIVDRWATMISESSC